jgi:hypothetical protein
LILGARNRFKWKCATELFAVTCSSAQVCARVRRILYAGGFFRPVETSGFSRAPRPRYTVGPCRASC